MNMQSQRKLSGGMAGQIGQPASVQLRALRKRFKNVDVVKGIDLEVGAGEFVVLVGPSGCGKSTILRMIAGLEDATEGDIFIGERAVNDVAAKDRDIAMVFQDYALYPHLSVRRNLSFGLEARKRPAEEIKERIEDASRILGIGDLLDRKPQQLSGGQRQRVAMGRAIVRRPRVFLFDEPLSNLDAKLRGQMRGEIKRLHQTLGATIVYVTHDQVEAMTLADRVVAMRDGSIVQQGTPDELYNAPLDIFVAGFIGAPSMNFIPCEFCEHEGKSSLQIANGPSLLISGTPPFDRARKGQQLILGLRPETLSIAEGQQSLGGRAVLHCVVNLVEPLGSDTLITVTIAGIDVVARLPPMRGIAPGAELSLVFDLARMHLFDAQTGRALAGDISQ